MATPATPITTPTRPSKKKTSSSPSPRHPSSPIGNTNSKKPKKATLTRDAMTIPQLQRLESQFAAGELGEQEFVKRFQHVIPDLTEPQLVELFLKIDANADGQVSWDEVTSYMFVHASDQDDVGHSDNKEDQAAKEKFVAPTNLHHRFNDPSARYHRSPVVRILFLAAGRGTYLTASLDGTVHQWDATTFTHRGCLIRRKTAIHDIVLLPMSKKLVVAESHSTISFHDCNSGSEYTRVSGTRLHQCTPTSMSVCWDDVARKEMLIVGDDTGSVHIFGLKYKAWQIKDSIIGPHETHIQKFEHVDRGYFPQLHTEWISKIEFVEDLNAVVSCSMDGTVKVCDLHGMLRGEKNCVRFIFERHQCGVTDFCWSAISRMMISCGVERGPLVWNPFSKTAVTQLDAGHASIMSVTVDERRQRIISVDAANHIHVHSLKNFKPLQNLHQRLEQPDGLGIGAGPSEGASEAAGSDTRLSDMLRIGAIYFHEAAVGGALITATQHLHKWKLSADITQGDLSPDEERAPIGSVLYNRSFHQVATAPLDNQSSVNIWDPSTGNILARFTDAHEGSAVTAMTFDSGERRLITGSHAGNELKIWNFGNRRLLARLVKLPHDVVKSRTGSIEDAVEQYAAAAAGGGGGNSNFELMGSGSYDELTDLNITIGNISLQSTMGSTRGSTRGYATGSTNKGLNGTTRMRESTIPPPLSGKVVGSILHQSLKQPYKTRSRSQKSKKNKKESISHRKKPRVDPSNETNSEVTKILFVEANSGGGAHIQHFIVTAGWDQQMYIFDDDCTSGQQEQGSLILGYLFAIPRPEQMYTKHTEDITSIAYCDPALASCSLDGCIRFWSLQNGEHLGSIDVGTPVHKLASLNLYSTVVAASESKLYLIETVSPFLLKQTIDMNALNVAGGCKTITALELSSSETHLIVGDVSGTVHILRISTSSMSVIHSWKAHEDRILNATIVENPEVLDIFVITTSQRAEVFMWTLDGHFVGNYGSQQHISWDLGQQSTYKKCNNALGNGQDKKQDTKQEKQQEKEQDTEQNKSTEQDVEHEEIIKSVPIALKVAKITVRHLPSVGEVWVRSNHHLAASTEEVVVDNNNGSVPGMAVAIEGPTFSGHKHTDILTVQRVGHDSVVGWDGNYPKDAKLRHCPLAEFNPKSQNPWRLDLQLSSVIGCVYFGSLPINDPYKCVCVCLQEIPRSHPRRTAIVIRDHSMVVRPFPSSNKEIVVRRSLAEAVQDDRLRRKVGVGEVEVAEGRKDEKEDLVTISDSEKNSDKMDKTDATRPASETIEVIIESNATTERSGWVTTSYKKYGKISKRSPKPKHFRNRRLWEKRLDTRVIYQPSLKIPNLKFKK